MSSETDDIPKDVLVQAASVVIMLPAFKSIEATGDAIERVARAIMAAKAETLPVLGNCGKYLAQDNAGQWHYINHAGTWQACPPPFPSVEEEREAVKHWLTREAEIHDELETQIVEADGKGWHKHFADVQRRNVDAIDAGRHLEKYAAAIRKRGEG